MTSTPCGPPGKAGRSETGEDWVLSVFERFADYLDDVWGDLEREDPYTIGVEESAIEILNHPSTKKAYDILVRRDRGKINKDDELLFLEALWACTEEVNPTIRVNNEVCNRLADGERIYLDPAIKDKTLAGNRKLAEHTYNTAIALRYLIGSELVPDSLIGVSEIRDNQDHLTPEEIERGWGGYTSIYDPQNVDIRKSPYDIAHAAGLPFGHNFIWFAGTRKRKMDGMEPLPEISDRDVMNALQTVADYCSYYAQKRKPGASPDAESFLQHLDEIFSPNNLSGIRRERIYEVIGLLVSATKGKGPQSGKTTQKVMERMRRKHPED